MTTTTTTTTMIIISIPPLRIKLDGDDALGTIFLLIPCREIPPPQRVHVLFRTVSRILFPKFIILLLLRTYCTTSACDILLLYIRLELRIMLLRRARVRTHRYDEIRRITLSLSTQQQCSTSVWTLSNSGEITVCIYYTVARARSGRYFKCARRFHETYMSRYSFSTRVPSILLLPFCSFWRTVENIL